MFPKKLWWYPLIFGMLGAFIGLVLRYAYTGAISGFPFKNVMHSHSHVLLLGFIFNSLLILVWTNFTQGIDKISYRYYVALQVCIALMLVTFILQGYDFFSILFSSLHLWISYILLIRLWRQLNDNKTINTFIKIGIVFHFLSSVGPYVLGPLMILEMQASPLYEQSIFFYLHFQYFGIFFVWMLAVLVQKTAVILSNKQLVIIAISLALLFAHSLDYSYDHWSINVIGGLGSILLLGVLLSFKRYFQKGQRAFKFIYSIILFVALVNIIGSIPIIANRVAESRLLLIGWLHLLFIGLYVPFIWVLLKRNISLLIWVIYGFMFAITEIVLVFPAMITQWIPIPIMWLLFLAYTGVFICICLVHIQLLSEKRNEINLR
jgi:hypothetical protein